MPFIQPRCTVLSSPSLGAGVRWDGRPVRAEASVEYEADRPTVDVGDALGVADTADGRER